MYHIIFLVAINLHFFLGVFFHFITGVDIAKEQQAKEAAKAVLGQIGLIKKSILARAFRGGLGTNDPAEDSAVELVKEALEKNTDRICPNQSKVKRTGIPAEIKPF